MKIERVTTVDDELVAAFARLMPQLSPSPPPDRIALGALIVQPGCTLLVARDGDQIVGTLTLTQYRIPTGHQARIDDVIVDTAMRGKATREALSREAIAIARRAGAKNVTLTSRPSREAANRLYERIGFQRLETNVYRFPL
jgi:ribosomal protein S18 acetylase RimI-like enzyme